MNNESVLGVIGCGYWGPNLIRNFSALSDCRVKWACDREETRFDRLSKLYPDIQFTSDADSIMDDDEVDAIAIATPVSSHFHLAQRSLLAGKHVFVEKPMAHSTAECQTLLDLARDGGLSLMVGHTFVYTAAVRKMKEIIASGEIGRVLYISSQRLNLGLFQRDINVAWDLAPHDISIILHLLGEKAESVNCQGFACMGPGVEDVANLSINFANGVFATIQTSWLDPNKVRRMTVVGEHKMIVYDDNETLEKLKVFDKRVQAPPRYDTFGEFFYSYHYGGVYSPFLDQEEPLRTECRRFIQSFKEGLPSESDGTKGLEVVAILEAAARSLANQGRGVPVA
jgi:predicted dehydrogenase